VLHQHSARTAQIIRTLAAQPRHALLGEERREQELLRLRAGALRGRERRGPALLLLDDPLTKRAYERLCIAIRALVERGGLGPVERVRVREVARAEERRVPAERLQVADERGDGRPARVVRAGPA
jgi:hypothetical protein